MSTKPDTSTYTTSNAVITQATINLDGCALTAWVTVKHENGLSQGFGGFCLGGTPGAKCGDHLNQPNVAAEFIVGVLRAAGVDEWSKLTGKAIRVMSSDGLIRGVGHIIEPDVWFFPKDRFEFFSRMRSEKP